MKRIITIAIFLILAFMFLVYSGVFRDNSDPLDVTRYYFQCLKNREGFLTYQISTSVFFDPDKHGDLYKKCNMSDITKIKLSLSEIKDDYAYVLTKIVYKNKQTHSAIARLKKVGKVWLMDDVRYSQNLD